MAKLSLDSGPEFKNISAFHSQQCAEKAIKAFLTFHKVRFSKTHDLLKLAAEVKPLDANLAKLITRAKGLTDYAVVFRYPSAENKPLTMIKAKKAIQQSQIIYDVCFKKVFGTWFVFILLGSAIKPAWKEFYATANNK